MDNEVVINGNRKKAALLLLVSLVFAIGGVAMIADGKEGGWFVAIFFGFGVTVAAYMLSPNAIRLTIGSSGIEVKSPIKPMKLAWSDVDEFYVGYIKTGYSKTKLIGITYSHSFKKMRAGRQMVSALTGMEGALPNHFSMPAEELCALLNSSKKQWEKTAQPGVQADRPEKAGPAA